MIKMFSLWITVICCAVSSYAGTASIAIQCNLDGPIYYGSLKFPFEKKHWILSSSPGQHAPICTVVSKSMPIDLSFNKIKYKGATPSIALQREIPVIPNTPVKNCLEIWDEYGFQFFPVLPSVYMTSQAGVQIELTFDIFESNVSNLRGFVKSKYPNGYCHFVGY